MDTDRVWSREGGAINLALNFQADMLSPCCSCRFAAERATSVSMGHACFGSEGPYHLRGKGLGGSAPNQRRYLGLLPYANLYDSTTSRGTPQIHSEAGAKLRPSN